MINIITIIKPILAMHSNNNNNNDKSSHCVISLRAAQWDNRASFAWTRAKEMKIESSKWCVYIVTTPLYGIKPLKSIRIRSIRFSSQSASRSNGRSMIWFKVYASKAKTKKTRADSRRTAGRFVWMWLVRSFEFRNVATVSMASFLCSSEIGSIQMERSAWNEN